MKLSIETITPKKAKQYLETNLSSQRNVSGSHVNKLAQMMLANEFDSLNGQTIKFNGSGKDERLIDGQHRLLAAIQANRTLKIATIRGCSSKAFKTIDNAQNSRNMANYYEIAGQKNSKVTAQVARWLYLYENRNRNITATMDKTPGHTVEWALENYPDIADRVAEVETHLNQFQKTGLGTKAHLAFMYYLASQKDRVQAYSLVEYLGSNIGEPIRSVANAKQLLMQLAKQSAEGRLPGNIRLGSVMTVMIAAWNATRGSRVRTVAGFKKAVKDVTGDVKHHGSRGIRLPECL